MSGADLDDIQALGGMFGINVVSVKVIRGVWQVRDADDHFYAVKRFRGGVSSLVLAANVQETAKDRDPDLLPELNLSVSGMPFVYHRGCPVLWMKWVNGRMLDYFRPGDRLRAFRSILRWQEAVKGVRVPLTLRRWGRWESVLEERIEEMRVCRRMASGCDSLFNRIYLKWWDFFYSQANLALERLGCEACRESAVEAEKHGEICHSDWAHHNLILRPGGSITVLDLEYLQGNTWTLDYVDLLNRFLLLDGGRPTVIPVFMDWIRRLKPLTPEDKKRFRALLFWPEAYWMSGRQVFIEQLHHSEQFFLAKYGRKVPCPDVWQASQRMIDESL